MSCIDLTGESSEEELAPSSRPLKRAKVEVKPERVVKREGNRVAWFDDVQIVDQDQAAQPAFQNAQVPDDEDLVVTGATGQVWNQDLPHTRHTCGAHKFGSIPCPSNSSHCEQCFCFICDCKASECQAWGTGATRYDHCNAFDNTFYKGLKEMKRRGVQLLQPTPASPPPRPSLVPANVQQGPAAPLRRIPDPAQDPSLFSIGSFSLKCKALNGNTIQMLKDRLVPFGFYVPPITKSAPSINYGNHLCLANLFDVEWSHQKGTTVPKHLKLSKLPMTPLAVPLSDLRVRRVTVVHGDGAAAPLTIGVTVDKKANLLAIMQQVKDHPAAQAAGNIKLIATTTSRHRSARVATKTKVLSEHEHESYSIQCFKVVRAPKEQLGSYALVFHCRADPKKNDMGMPNLVGCPVIIPLGSSLATGGPDSNLEVCKRILQAIALLRKTGASGPVDSDRIPFNLHRATENGQGINLFAMSRPLSSSSTYQQFVSSNKAIMYLVCEWSDADLGQYDMEAWEKPPLHDSASAEKLAESKKRAEAEVLREEEKRKCKTKPREAAGELESAAMAESPQTPQNLRRLRPPQLRVSLDLQPSSTDAVRGTISFKLYAWGRGAATPHRELFSSATDWRNSAENYCFPLAATMDLLLVDNPEAKAMQTALQTWRNKDIYLTRNLKGLMEMLESGELPEAPQPAGLTVSMRPYQRQSLQFMLDAERGNGGFRQHFWVEVKAGERPYWYSPILRRASLEVPSMPWGGFMAEEMGLGKTVEALGLILANPAPPLPVAADGAAGAPDASGRYASRATLVVCAVSLVGQWQEEARSKLNGSLRIHQYHGQNRIRDPKQLAEDFELVVTTYATLSRDYSTDAKDASTARKLFPPLGSIKWHRIILDEGHTVKQPTVAHSKACTALVADRRWICTGTPINTSIDDLLGQFDFLHLAPFNSKPYFNSTIKPAYTSGRHMGGGSAVPLLYCLGRTMIRHTKLQVLGGEEVLKLPPKTEELVPVILTPDEQRLYKEAHARANREFQIVSGWGQAAVSKRLLQIMALLLPLRRICSGGFLTAKDLEVDSPLHDLLGAASSSSNGPAPIAPADQECSICLDNLETAHVTPCGHWFCRECITGALASQAKCPLCRAVVVASQLKQGRAPEIVAVDEGASSSSTAQGSITSESKLQALLKALRDMREQDESAKALIFTQYTSTLDWLKVKLTEEGFGYRTISGSMPLNQRSKAIDAFQRDPPTTVFLLSIRSGSVGINLTAASHVFLLEPALNPALDQQAIGRAWRMGQTRPVTVKRLYVKGSVEERIMEVVKARQGGSTGDAMAEASFEHMRMVAHRQKHKAQEIAGSIKSDRQALKLAELQLLFKEPDFAQVAAPQADAAAEVSAAAQQISSAACDACS